MDDVRRRADEQSRKAVNWVQEHADELVNRQKENTARKLEEIADAVERTAGKLHEEGDHQIASMVEQLCDNVREGAAYLGRHSAGDFVADLEEFARRRPELFIGGTFIGGLLVARFLKASRRERQRGDSPPSSMGERAPASEQAVPEPPPGISRPAPVAMEPAHVVSAPDVRATKPTASEPPRPGGPLPGTGGPK